MTTQAQYLYTKRWHHEAAQGIYRTVPAAPARMHVLSLQAAGMSLRSISAAAGLSPVTLSRLADPNVVKVHRDTASAALAVPLHVATTASTGTTEPFVPRIGTVRRIQALLALGWRHEDIAEHSGVTRPHLLLSQQGRWVTRSTHDAIAGAYRGLSTRTGPSQRTRTRAAHRGYLTPIHWDDIDLDETPDLPDDMPCAHGDCANTATLGGYCRGHWYSTYRGQPGHGVAPDGAVLDEVAVLRRMRGDKAVRVSHAEADAVVARLQAAGVALAEIERRTGINTHRRGYRTGQAAS